MFIYLFNYLIVKYGEIVKCFRHDLYAKGTRSLVPEKNMQENNSEKALFLVINDACMCF